MFWFNFIQFIEGYFNEYERFCNYKQTSWNYKTFISSFFTLLKFINDAVNEKQWVISLHKLFLYQRDFFVKVCWYSFWTMKFTIDCISFIAFWSFGGPWVKVVLCFSDKRWVYSYHWCWWLVSKSVLGFASMVSLMFGWWLFNQSNKTLPPNFRLL